MAASFRMVKYMLYSKLSWHADSLPLRKALKQSMSKEEKKRPLAQAYSVGVWMGMGNLVNGQFIMCWCLAIVNGAICHIRTQQCLFWEISKFWSQFGDSALLQLPLNVQYWYCLVLWNINFMFPFSWEFHHPNWLSVHHFSEGLVGIPPTRLNY